MAPFLPRSVLRARPSDTPCPYRCDWRCLDAARLSNTRRQVEGMRETLKTATAPSPAVSAVEAKAIAANDKFLGGQYESQQLMLKWVHWRGHV